MDELSERLADEGSYVPDARPMLRTLGPDRAKMAAGMMDLLVLASDCRISLTQARPYGEIAISRGASFAIA